MADGALRRPGKGSATGKRQPHKGRRDMLANSASRNSSQVVGHKRSRVVEEADEPNVKKSRILDIGSINTGTEEESDSDGGSSLSEFDGGANRAGVNLYRSEDVAPLYPGLCSESQVAANTARREKEFEEEFLQRKSNFDALVRISCSLQDLTITAVAYNTSRNCPFSERGKDLFENGTLSLQGDKEYLHWARLGSKYAVVAIKTTAITSVREILESQTAGLEIFQEDMPKSYKFFFENQNATEDIKAVLQALSALPRYLNAASKYKTPTCATSAASSVAPAINTEEARRLANEAETRKLRAIYLEHKDDPEKPYWPGYSVAQLVDFLKAKDKFHNIVDTTMWSHGSSKLSKRKAQDRVTAYLEAYPTEGTINPTAQRKSKKAKLCGRAG